MKTHPLIIGILLLGMMLLLPGVHALNTGIAFYDNAETGNAFTVYNFSQGGSARVFNYSADRAYNGTKSLQVNNTADFQALYVSLNATDLGQLTGYTFSAYFYDDGRAGGSLMGTGAGLQNQGTALFIGVYPPLSATTYFIAVNASNIITAVTRSVGWHHAQIVFNSSTRLAMSIDGTTVYNDSVDDISSNGAFLVFEEGFGTGGSSYYDDILLYQTGNVSGPAAPNSPPVMVAVQESVTANNLTIILRANSTDTDNATVRYSTIINRSGTIENLNLSSYVTSGILKNYANYTVTVPGNYSLCAFANDGLNNSVATLCTPFTEITFPVPPNSPPSLRSALLTVSADNQTLHLFANATDPDNATVDYSYTLFKNGLSFSSGSAPGVTQGITFEIGTASLSAGTAGNYTFNVTVAGNATVLSSNTLEATVGAAVDTTTSKDAHVLNVVIQLLLVAFLIALLTYFLRDQVFLKDYLVYFYALIGLIIIVAALMVLL